MATKDNMIKLNIGELLQIERPDGKQINTKVGLIKEESIWALDFLKEIIWVADWREQAFSIRIIRNDRCFAFLGYISGNTEIDGINMTHIVRISPIEEVQRRTSYRLQYLFDVFIRKEGSDEEEEYIKCQGLDLSEGGLGLNAEIKWAVGTDVSCMFKIKNEEYQFCAKIVRRLDWVMAGQYIYRVGLRFSEEDERQMKKIRRFIYNQQVARD